MWLKELFLAQLCEVNSRTEIHFLGSWFYIIFTKEITA